MPKIDDAVLIQRAGEAHHGKFSYGPFVKNPKASGRLFTVICPSHGEYLQQVTAHLSGKGCKKCAVEVAAQKSRLTLEDVKQRTSGFGRNYGYLGLDYSKPAAPTVRYLCATHGEVVQNLHNHLAGKGCAECFHRPAGVANRAVGATRVNRDISDEELLAKSEGYIALRVDRSKRHAEIVSLCPDHGEFSQPIRDRLVVKRGCPACAYHARGVGQRLSFSEVVSKANIMHGNTYEYVEQIQDEVKWLHIVCKKHGGFLQRAGNHLAGEGCVKCMGDKTSTRLSRSDVEWVARAEEAHGGRYTYRGEVRSRGERARLRVVCSSHGEFTQDAKDHVYGSGCSKCVGRISKQNIEMAEFLRSIGIEYALEQAIPGTRQQLDLLVPEKNIAIEMNGIYWHSDMDRGAKTKPASYHAKKQASASAAGIRIIHIFDDEWKQKRPIIERTLRNNLGRSIDEKVSARACKVAEVPPTEARRFLAQHHIQGFAASSAYLGLHHNGKLVAVGSFAMKERGRSGRKSKTSAELTRYCTSANVRGGMSKIISAAQTLLGFKVLTTFSDIRFFEGASYSLVGFEEDGRLPPDYFYCKGGKRVNKRMLQKSKVLKLSQTSNLVIYDAKYTELQLSELNGYDRVWDCGKIRWVKRWQ